jgi:hypothetical protein
LEYHFRLTDVSVPGEPSVCRVSLPSRWHSPWAYLPLLVVNSVLPCCSMWPFHYHIGDDCVWRHC